MSFKTPKFWAKKNLISFSLLPLSFFYFFFYSLKNFLQKPYKISKPVICIGNLIAGGSGKTPTAIAIGKILREICQSTEFEFAYLSKGYMGDGAKFVSLREGKHVAKNVGDEPMLLVKTAPTFVAKNRLFGAKQINNFKKIKLLILDDGMQNNSLYKDLTILVIDGKIGFGNGFMIPAGPMRESFGSGIKKADLVVVIGEMNKNLAKKLANKKIIRADILPQNINQFRDKKILAFCGLAYPQKFFTILKNYNLEINHEISFPDHYSYNDSDLQKLLKTAQERNLELVTTKKDWIKFSKKFQEKIPYLDIELEFLDKDLIVTQLKKIIKL